jgi:hypothetical protein
VFTLSSLYWYHTMGGQGLERYLVLLYLYLSYWYYSRSW